MEKGESAQVVLDNLARGITNKLIHSPTVNMKNASGEGRDESLKLIRELFDLPTAPDDTD